MNIRTWQELKALSNNQWPDDECMKEEIAQLRAELSQPVSMKPVAWQERQSRNVNPQGVITSWSSWYQSSGLPKGYVKPENPRIETTYDWRPLYTADQLAQARQQGAEEAYKDANMQMYKDAIKQVRKLSERIAELEQRNAVFLEALKRARDTAMKYTLVARIPECGHFGGIAQDLDYVYAAIAEVKP